MSVSIDQQFVEFVVKSLVGNPDQVVITRTIDEKGVLLELTVAPEDLGRVIGKRGGTAQSLRTLLRALGTKNDARYNLKIVDSDGGAGATSPRSTRTNEVSDPDTTAVDGQDDKPVEDSTPEPVENDDDLYEKKHRQELADLDDLDI